MFQIHVFQTYKNQKRRKTTYVEHTKGRLLTLVDTNCWIFQDFQTPGDNGEQSLLELHVARSYCLHRLAGVSVH